MTEVAEASGTRPSAPVAPRLDIDDHIPALFATLSGKLGLHIVRQNLRQYDLDLRASRILQILGCDGRSTIFEIADRIAMDRGGTSRSIAHLEERGLLTRTSDPLDRRKSYVELTDSGWELHADITGFAIAREKRLLAGLSANDSARLKKLLKALIDEADVMIAEEWAP